MGEAGGGGHRYVRVWSESVDLVEAKKEREVEIMTRMKRASVQPSRVEGARARAYRDARCCNYACSDSIDTDANASE